MLQLIDLHFAVSLIIHFYFNLKPHKQLTSVKLQPFKIIANLDFNFLERDTYATI